jgi:cytochrome c biogenesis protein CcdA
MIQYALLLGMLAALNPCGAPLLPAYLGLFTMSGGDEPAIRRVHRGVHSGSTLSLGFLAVFVVVGLPLTAATAALTAIGPGVIGILGIAIIVTAGLSLRGVMPPLPGRWLTFRGGRGTPALLTFGALYAFGSLGCELPLFLAATGVASTHNTLTAIGATLAYGVGMGLVVIALSVIVSLFSTRRRVRLHVRWVPIAGGVVAICSGAYLLFFAGAEIADPALAAALSAPLSISIGSTEQLLQIAPVWWAIALVALIGTVAGLTAIGSRRNTHE